MTILSGTAGSGGFFPQQRADRAIEGTPGEGRLPLARTATNPILAQTDTAIVGGAATDGDYIIGVTDPKGLRTEAKFTRAAAEANAAIAAALVVAFNLAMGGIASAVIDGGDPLQINITFEHEGIAYVLDESSPGASTITLANTQVAGGVAQAVARFVERGASVAGQNPNVAPLEAGSDDDSLWGIVLRPIGEFAGVEGTVAQDPDTPDVVPAGNSLSVAYDGAVNMRNVGSVASVAGGPMFGVINTAGGQQLGQARADADGGNTFAYSLQITRWIDVVGVGEVGRAFVRTI